MIVGADADASANKATVWAKPHKLEDGVILIDYPHFDSTKLANKLQFLFSRFILDHVFLVCAAMERMDSDDTMQLLDLIKAGFNSNYTVILNRCDDLWKDCRNDVNKAREVYKELKNEVNKKRVKENGKVILTCLADLRNLEEQDGLNSSGILLGDEFKKNIYSIMNRSVAGLKLALKTGNIIDEYKAKIISIQNERGSKEMKLMITNNKKKCKNENPNGFDIVDSMEDLLNEIKFFKIENPRFKCRFDDFKVIKDFNHFFTDQVHAFVILEDNEN